MSANGDPNETTPRASLDRADLPGALVIALGDQVEISGSHNGAVEVYGSLIVRGILTGSLTVESLGRVEITGDVDGSIEVRVAGTVTIHPGGRVAGTIVNHGSVNNQGWRSGRVEGRQPDDTEGSTVAEPLPGIERYPSLPRT